MLNPNPDFGQMLMSYLKGFLWSLVASISFAVGISIALLVFDLFSREINEWEEIKKGNIGVALIFISLILVIGLLIHKVI